MVYNIALVDDEIGVSGQLEKWLMEYAAANSLEFYIAKYTSTSEFLDGAFMDFNIIFLDINLPDDVNGMMTARRIRQAQSKAVIIFCTYYAQYAIDGYEVDALGYLIKPVSKDALFREAGRAVRAVKQLGVNKIIVKTLDGQKFVNVSDIVYIEVMVHNLFFHIKGKDGLVTERTRGALNDLESKLADMRFARCSACYLVNLSRVTGISKKTVELEGGVTLTLGRKYVKSFMDQLMRYVSDFGIIDN